MRSYLTVHSLSALVLLGLASRSAHAQSSCSADSQCAKGLTCQVVGAAGCATPACPPGEKCEDLPTTCMNQEVKACRPGPCNADSDCAEGMVCYTHTESNCPAVACAPGQECPTPDCSPKTESQCLPRYVLPCATASDCGSGFTCESAGEECECSGSAGTPKSDGGTPPPPEESCTCKPSEELGCRVVPVDCESDSDCTAGWSCTALVSPSDCSSTPGFDPGAPGSGAQGGASPKPRPNCEPTVSVKQCLPPYYSQVSGGRGFDGNSSSDNGENPTLGTGGSASGGVASPAVPSAESDKGDATASAGCAVAHGSRSGSALALLAALGLFGALRRRRVR